MNETRLGTNKLKMKRIRKKLMGMETLEARGNTFWSESDQNQCAVVHEEHWVFGRFSLLAYCYSFCLGGRCAYSDPEIVKGPSQCVFEPNCHRLWHTDTHIDRQLIKHTHTHTQQRYDQGSALDVQTGMEAGALVPKAWGNLDVLSELLIQCRLCIMQNACSGETWGNVLEAGRQAVFSAAKMGTRSQFRSLTWQDLQHWYSSLCCRELHSFTLQPLDIAYIYETVLAIRSFL